jgi:hypothetical protein
VAACAAPSSSNLTAYYDTTGHNLWFCRATNTWMKFLSTDNTGEYLATGATGTAPANPASGNVACYFDSTSLTQICLDTAGNAFTMVKGLSAVSHQFVTNTDALGIQHQAAILAGDVPTLNQSTTGNAATATALAATPTKCGAGNYPLGVDVGGNAQNCTAAGGGAAITDGFIAPFGPLNQTFNGGFTPTAGTVYYYKLPPIAASFSWKSLSMLIGAAASGTHVAMALMDGGCSKVTGSDINVTGLTTGGGTGYLSAHPSTSPTVLAAAAPYYLAIVGEASYLWFAYATGYDMMLNAGLADNAYFTGATAATGSGASLAVPASCGAKTRIADSSRPVIYLNTNN